MPHQAVGSGPMAIHASLGQNITFLKEIFASCDDILFTPIVIGNRAGCLVFLSDMVDGRAVFDIKQSLSDCSNNLDHMSIFQDHFPFIPTDKANDLQTVVSKILSGNLILFIDQIDEAMVFHIEKSRGRRVTEASIEPVVRGPKEGFVEGLQTNLQLIRKRIKTPELKVERMTIGEKTKTEINVLYLKGTASDAIVEEVRQRLSRIEIDGILDSHYLESMIKDSPWSPFPTLLSTERPDSVSGHLLDGKVAILTDGSPSALIAPVTFVEFLHSAEDYYESSLMATITRWVRFLGLFVALILPAYYVGLTTFHQDLLQTPLLIRLAANREGLPYSVLLEGIFMFLTFEFIREAGIRMPKVIGGPVVTIIVLAIMTLIAVNAGLIGPLMSVVVAVSAMVTYILPNYAFHQIIRLCTIPLMILAGMFGFMGILVGLMFGLTHLLNLRSFGVPYFSPVSPARKEGWKDVFIRAPWWAIHTRVPGLDVQNFVRAGAGNRPKPPRSGGTNDK
ncbi:spore germination protein [Camelliibacillus cellulosilyticus]|uniref:Spore germination protein n=1 Tax=Camelliibacillus cellulosilyticus TaxID=2174486 RepID=A0ABV9GIN8_9BACL